MLVVSIISIVLNILMFILLTKVCRAFNKTGDNLIRSIFMQDNIINSFERRLKKCEEFEERISYLEEEVFGGVLSEDEIKNANCAGWVYKGKGQTPDDYVDFGLDNGFGRGTVHLDFNCGANKEE